MDRHLYKLRIHIFLGVLALFVEVFICNIRSFQSVLYEEKSVLDYEYRIDGAEVTDNGDVLVNGESATITICTNDEIINNIHVDIEVMDSQNSQVMKMSVCDVTLRIQDELLYGGNVSSRLITQKKVLHELLASQFFFFESFGGINALSLEICPQQSNIIHINDITLNARRPIIVSFSRLLWVLLILEMIYIFRPDSWVWKRKALEPGKKGTILLIIIYSVIFFSVFNVLIKNPLIWKHDFNPYASLAKAFSSGKLYVGIADKKIAEIENALISWEMDDERIMFDYALYKGRYYVYFGVLPCLLLYLPYYLITGNDLPDAVCQLLLFALLIPGIYFLFKEIIRRVYAHASIAVHILLSIAMLLGCNTIAVLADPLVYHVAILFGVVLTIWGMYFIMSVLSNEGHNASMFIGILLLALVAACRPTLLIYSIGAVIFVIYYCINKSNSRDGITKQVIRVVIFLSPYVIVACGLMIYNALRFDSPFQFGMIYNMTVIPSKKTAISIVEMVPVLMYEYLFRMPSFEHYFPFLKDYITANMMMSGTIYYFQTVGYGILLSNPVLWSLIWIPFNCKKEKKGLLFWLSLAGVASFFVLMFFGFYMTQVVASRYVFEFSCILFVIAAILWLRMWQELSNRIPANILRCIFSVMILLPAMIHSMQLFNSFSFPLEEGNAGYYYEIFYNWHFL